MMQPGPLMGAALALALAAPAAAGTATHPEPRDFVVSYAREPDLERLEAFDLAILDPDVALPDSALRAARTELNEEREIAIWKDGVTL